jgi:hypothetical protein
MFSEHELLLGLAASEQFRYQITPCKRERGSISIGYSAIAYYFLNPTFWLEGRQ